MKIISLKVRSSSSGTESDVMRGNVQQPLNFADEITEQLFLGLATL